MRPYLCKFVPLDEQLWRLPNREAYEVTFRFDLTPIECVGQPDEEHHLERRNVRLTIEGPAFNENCIPTDPQAKMRVLYWHAVQTLKQGNDTLSIDSQYAAAHKPDPQKIVYPPNGPFEIILTPKMGFQA